MKHPLWSALGIAGLIAAGVSAPRANPTPRPKMLEVNKGTRVPRDKQLETPIGKVSLGYGPMFNSKAMAYVRIEGPKVTPQCVIHLATFDTALALAAQLQSDKLQRVSCIDEMDQDGTVVITYPPRPGNPADCPKGLGCNGQSFDLDVHP